MIRVDVTDERPERPPNPEDAVVRGLLELVLMFTLGIIAVLVYLIVGAL